jgi:hypothetical protein
VTKIGTFAEIAVFNYHLPFATKENKDTFSVSDCTKQKMVCLFSFPFAENNAVFCLQNFGNMETWRHEDMETWRYGDMETWRHGDMEIWRHGNMETWRHGDMETWRHGDMDTWRHGDMDMKTSNGKWKHRRFS